MALFIMGIFRSNLDKKIIHKIKDMEKKMKNSFALIRGDVREMQVVVEAMRKFLKNKDKQFAYARKEDNKIREEFRRDVDIFTQKMSQLSIALSEVKVLQKEVVVVRDLAKIEEKIKTNFKEEVESFKEQEREFKQYINEFNRKLTDLEKRLEKNGNSTKGNGGNGVKKFWFFKNGKK
jgi:uncharacterized protein YukE